MRLRFCIYRKHAIIFPSFYHISCQFTRKWIANKKAIMQKPESRWQERKTCLRVNYKIIRTAILIIFRRNFTVRESENTKCSCLLSSFELLSSESTIMYLELFLHLLETENENSRCKHAHCLFRSFVSSFFLFLQ